MDFELKEYKRNISNEELIEDLKRVANVLNKSTVTKNEYVKNGSFGYKTLSRRFGSWNNALLSANLNLSVVISIPNEELFKNIEEVWIKTGKQPSYRTMNSTISQYSAGTYENRFGNWRKALRAFVEFINNENGKSSEEDSNSEVKSLISDGKHTVKIEHKTKRDINDSR